MLKSPRFTLGLLCLLLSPGCGDSSSSSHSVPGDSAADDTPADAAQENDGEADAGDAIGKPGGDVSENVEDGLDAGGESAEIAEPPAIPQFGVNGEVTYRLLLGAPWVYEPTDLEFDPNHPDRLWVTSRGDDAFVALNLDGEGQGLPAKFTDYYHTYADGVSSLAFSENNTFASCQESLNTYNGAWEGDGKAGASLWPADPEAFELGEGSTNWGALLDNLNGSALCMGIAWLHDHAFYLFDGENGDLKLFDFQRPSAPGAVNPAGGIKYRILKGELIREPGVPSHMFFHAPSRRLLFTDTGNHRVLWLDVDSGEPGTSIFNNPDFGTRYKKWVNPVWGEWETNAPFVLPSGIVVRGDRVFVSDHATGIIYGLDMEGNVLSELDTGRGFGAISGLELDRQGRLLFVDMAANEVIRVEP